MKKSAFTTLFTMMSASTAFAGLISDPKPLPSDVPEAGVTGSLAALAAVAAVGAIAWERRRRSNKPD